MADRALTTPEIDHLLSIFRGGRAALRSEAEVETYDVNLPNRMPRGALGALRIRYAQASRALGQHLRDSFGIPVTVTLETLDQVVLDPWRGSLPDPCCAFLVEMRPLKEPAVLVLEHSLAFVTLDRLLGGDGQTKVDPRDLTRTEVGVLEEIFEHVIEVHEMAWQPYTRLTGRITKPVFVPTFIREIPDKEIILAATYRIEGIGEPTLIRFALPTSELEPHLQHEPRVEVSDGDKGQARDAIARQLADVEVDVGVEIGCAELQLQDLVALEQEDVIILDRGVEESLELLVEGQTMLEGHLGRQGRRLLFRVGGTGCPGQVESPPAEGQVMESGAQS